MALILCGGGAWPAAAEDGLKLHVAITAYMAAHGADLSTTMYCLGAKTCREVNPIMKPLMREPALAGLTKMGTAACSSWLLLKTHQRHPKLTFWLAVGGATVTTAVAVHNMNIHESR